MLLCGRGPTHVQLWLTLATWHLVAGGSPTCSSLSEYFCGFLLPWLFLRSFFNSA